MESFRLDAIEGWCRKAAGEGARLILFPELVIGGHWCAADAHRFAEQVPDGASTRRLETVAKKCGLVISTGLGEIENGVMYNAQILVGPDGYIGKQRKTHMSRDEYFYYRPGTQFPVYDVGFCKVGTIICYDIMFPEVARILALHGAEVLLAPHAACTGRWRERGQARIVRDQKKQWRKICASRACDNGCFVAVTNQAGPAGPETAHAGGIMFFDPGGDVIGESRTQNIEDEMVVVELKAESLARCRSRACFPLLTRRPEIYEDLCRRTF